MREIEAALNYHTDPTARDRFSRRLESALLHVERYPGTLARRPDLSASDLYFWPVTPFWLVVRKQTRGLLLVAVPHCSQDVRGKL